MGADGAKKSYPKVTPEARRLGKRIGEQREAGRNLKEAAKSIKEADKDLKEADLVIKTLKDRKLNVPAELSSELTELNKQRTELLKQEAVVKDLLSTKAELSEEFRATLRTEEAAEAFEQKTEELDRNNDLFKGLRGDLDDLVESFVASAHLPDGLDDIDLAMADPNEAIPVPEPVVENVGDNKPDDVEKEGTVYSREAEFTITSDAIGEDPITDLASFVTRLEAYVGQQFDQNNPEHKFVLDFFKQVVDGVDKGTMSERIAKSLGASEAELDDIFAQAETIEIKVAFGDDGRPFMKLKLYDAKHELLVLAEEDLLVEAYGQDFLDLYEKNQPRIDRLNGRFLEKLKKGDRENALAVFRSVLALNLEEEDVDPLDFAGMIYAIQDTYGLNADAILGPKTWKKLQDLHKENVIAATQEEVPVEPKDDEAVVTYDFGADAEADEVYADGGDYR